MAQKAMPLVGDPEPVEVIHEDDDIIAVNKPPHVISAPKHRYTVRSDTTPLICMDSALQQKATCKQLLFVTTLFCHLCYQTCTCVLAGSRVCSLAITARLTLHNDRQCIPCLISSCDCRVAAWSTGSSPTWVGATPLMPGSHIDIVGHHLLKL